jgi:hypothetical protein
MTIAVPAGLVLAGCPLSSAVEEALPLPPVTAAVEATFQAAVSTVTSQVIADALKSVVAVTAPTPAPRFSALADEASVAGPSTSVDSTTQPEGGGTIHVTGTLTGSGTDAAGTMSLDLKAMWNGLAGADGATSSGTETITGTMGWDAAGATTTDLSLKGSFDVDSKTFTFAMNVARDGDRMTYTGKVNGEVVTGSFVPASTARPVAPREVAAACTPTGTTGLCRLPQGGGPEECWSVDYTYCLEFTGAAWTSAGIGAQCGAAPRVVACPTAGLQGRCDQTLEGKSISHYAYDSNDVAEGGCVADGGTWTAYP